MTCEDSKENLYVVLAWAHSQSGKPPIAFLARKTPANFRRQGMVNGNVYAYMHNYASILAKKDRAFLPGLYFTLL